MPPSIVRRGFLLGSAAGLTALAGRSALGDDEEAPGPVRLGVIRLDNDDTDPHTLHLQVERDGELAYWQSHPLVDAGEDGTGSVLLDECRCRRGRYRLRVRPDDAEEWVSFEPSESVGAWFTVEDDGGLGYGYIHGERFERTEPQAEGE